MWISERGSSSASVNGSGGGSPFEGRRHGGGVEVPRRIVGEGPAGRDLARPATRRRRWQAGVASPIDVAQDTALAGQRPARGRRRGPPRPRPDAIARAGVAARRRARDRSQAQPRAVSARRDHRSGRPRCPTSAGARIRKTSAWLRKTSAEPTSATTNARAAPLDERPVGHPQREQGQHQRDGLGPIPVELLLEPDGRRAAGSRRAGPPSRTPSGGTTAWRTARRARGWPGDRSR